MDGAGDAPRTDSPGAGLDSSPARGKDILGGKHRYVLCIYR